MERARRGRPGAAALLLAAAVGMAFADASVVVLALPSVYAEFGTTVVEVSWVLTGYTAVVTLAGLGLAAVRARPRPMVLTAAGLCLFSATCLVCGIATTLGWLMAGRALQGLGAALLLVGALPVLAALLGPGTGRAVWGAAATAGLAAGPAAGGLLTEVFDWRAIFLVQVPLALVPGLLMTLPRRRSRGAVETGTVLRLAAWPASPPGSPRCWPVPGWSWPARWPRGRPGTAGTPRPSRAARRRIRIRVGAWTRWSSG
jgi:MFS family permease